MGREKNEGLLRMVDAFGVREFFYPLLMGS